MKKYIKELILGVGLAVTAFVGINFQFNVLPVLMLVAILFTIAVLLDKNKSAAAGASHEVAKSHRVEFEHIGGQDMPKREIMEALDFMRNREKIKELGIRPLKGIILTGPPGTGKTLLAKAAASYTDSAFVAASGSEFVEMYVGVGASRVRDLFKKARMLAKKEGKDSAIVFIDEIDVIGGKRGGNSSHQEYDQTLNQLLTEMDGMGTTSSPFVLVVAATNRLDILDPALIRPGRFDRQIKVDLPDKVGRLAILEIQTRNKPLAEGVSLEMVARETYGFSGHNWRRCATRRRYWRCVKTSHKSSKFTSATLSTKCCSANARASVRVRKNWSASRCMNWVTRSLRNSCAPTPSRTSQSHRVATRWASCVKFRSRMATYTPWTN